MADAVIKPKFAPSGAGITITMAGLANAGYRESTLVSNATNRYSRVNIAVKAQTANAGSVSGDKAVHVFLAPAMLNDEGSPTIELPTPVTGSDADITAVEGNLRYLGSVPFTAINQTQQKIFSVDNVPYGWSLVVKNATGTTLSATAGNNTAHYQGENDEGVTS